MLQRRIFRLSSAIFLSSLLICAQAVELGEPLVRSYIGQPLSADIELTGIASETATVQAALANPDVYRGANIAMHPALAALNLTIVRRDGRRFLHVASPKTVQAEYVHIFFELTENGRPAVRQATLWFTPDPHPAPPAPKPAPVPVAVAAATAVVPVAASLVQALAKAPAPAPRVAAPLLRAAAAARPDTCAQQFTAAQLGACTALDAKNAALTAQIVELEDKVRLLTVAMQGATEPAAPKRLVPKPMAPPKPAVAAPSKPTGTTPWLVIGIASVIVFALVGVLVYFLRRKRKGAKAKPAAKASPGFIASVKNRLLPAKKGAEPAVNVEPGIG